MQAGDTTTGTIKVEMIKTPINDDVSTSVTGTLKATAMENDNATGTNPKSKVAYNPVSFQTDSWSTIQNAVQDNNTSVYNVGDTKEITIDGTNYTVRIANKSTNENCSSTNYSESSCGFVVEFVDIVENRIYDENYNKWSNSSMNNYLQTTFYNKLPQDLKDAIIPTRVYSTFVTSSGEGILNVDTRGDYSSGDKIYLLDIGKIVTSSFIPSPSIRQLDCYAAENIRTADDNFQVMNIDKAYKKYQGNDNIYWLRSDIYHTSQEKYFISVIDPLYQLGYNGHLPNCNNGIAPAFRIG